MCAPPHHATSLMRLPFSHLLRSAPMKAARSTPNDDRLLATRRSLVERLVNWEDQHKWQEFFETYWRLIYGVARRGGLTDAEAQDVVQETVITVAKNITKYEREAGPFKGWLLHITRWRIADQFRKRAPADNSRPARGDSRRGTATIDRIPDGFDLDAAWEEEWQRNVLAAALDRVKRKIDPKRFQIFDCLVTKQWPASKVATELHVSIAQVYLVKHRVSALVKREVAAVEKHR
jgi:RNA polymerase sigma-70 factor (ECF subfamily)